MNTSRKYGMSLAVAGVFACVLAFVCLAGCSSGNDEADDPENRIMKITLSVPDMCCSSCALRTKTALEQYAGVEKAYANFLEKQAWARYDPLMVDPDLLRRAVASLGFKEVIIVSNEPYVPEAIP